MTLCANQLSVQLEASHYALRDVDFTLKPAQLHALIGPNGSGKTTLLKLLSGHTTGHIKGSITLEERALSNWSADTLARHRAVYSQNDVLRFPFTAREVVALGRLPWKTTREVDHIVDATLEITDCSLLAERPYTQLSGGERARVRLARAIAQIWPIEPDSPRYLLLDEPLAHLDFAYQHRCLGLLKQLANQGAGILLVLHDPHLALSYADTASLMSGGQILCAGSPDEVLTTNHLSAAYSVSVNGGDGRPFHLGSTD